MQRSRTIVIAIALVAISLCSIWFFLGKNESREETPSKSSQNRSEVVEDRTLVNGNDAFDRPAPEPNAPRIPTGPQIEAFGRIIDHQTGRGVPNATVTITEGTDARIPPLTHSRTDSTGVFTCEFSERSSFRMTVRAEGYAPAYWEVVDGATPSGVPFELANLELPIAPESVLWISPKLQEADPEERFIVEIQLRQPRTPAELGSPLVEKKSTTLLAPETRIGRLSTGKYLLSYRTSRQRLGSREIELGMGQELTIDFVLGPPVPINGVVLHNGSPVSGGRLVIWGRENHSNTAAVVGEDGRYSIQLPAIGNYSFAFSPRYEHPQDGSGGSQELNIEGPGTVDLLFSSSRLVGQVLTPEGGPAAQLSGTLFGPQALSFTTDEEGWFEFENVPHGSYRWLFQLTPEESFGPVRDFEVSGDTHVVYEFENSTELEVVVVRDSPSENSNEVGRPQVCLLEDGGNLTPLRPGSRPNFYRWPVNGGQGVVFQRGWAPWFFELPPSHHPSPQTAILTPGGELTVTLLSRDGQPLGFQPFRVEPLDAPSLPDAWCQRQTGAGGSTLLTLPPGTYRIVGELTEGEVSTEIRLHPRTTTEARLP